MDDFGNRHDFLSFFFFFSSFLSNGSFIYIIYSFGLPVNGVGGVSLPHNIIQAMPLSERTKNTRWRLGGGEGLTTQFAACTLHTYIRSEGGNKVI